MKKLNCWEFMNCGRQPGGNLVKKHGPCPAATESTLHGMNNGKNGGRGCWTVEDTGSYAQKLRKCLHCDFFSLVGQEEQDSFENSREILASFNLSKTTGRKC